jgi:hypothetical protein
MYPRKPVGRIGSAELRRIIAAKPAPVFDEKLIFEDIDTLVRESLSQPAQLTF